MKKFYTKTGVELTVIQGLGQGSGIPWGVLTLVKEGFVPLVSEPLAIQESLVSDGNDYEFIMEAAQMSGIRIENADSAAQCSLNAIHLLNPNIWELTDALDRAERDGFGLILIHTQLTWPYPACK